MNTQETIGDFQQFRQFFVEEAHAAHEKWKEFQPAEFIEYLNQEERKLALTDSLRRYDRWQEAEQQLHEFDCGHITRQLGKVLPQLICSELNHSRARAIQQLDELFAQYEEDRKNGVSFLEREEKLNRQKIATLTAVVKGGEVKPGDIVVRPAQEWLPERTGYDSLKAIGVREYVKRNLFFMYELKSKQS